MKIQRHFAPTGGHFQSESVARFIGICIKVSKQILGYILKKICL
ncbi:MAG: hypothetical protein AB1410_00305 [Acidobacteriota bacterium]